MTASEDPHGPGSASEASDPTPQGRSPLSFLLAAIPFGLVATYRYGLIGLLARLAPVLVFGGAWRLLPFEVRLRPWAIWMLLLGGFGGGMVIHIVLELR